MSFAEVLPLAFVMVVGAQIVASFFLATTERWAANSIAYVAGGAISITAEVTIAYFVGRDIKTSGGKHKGTIDYLWCAAGGSATGTTGTLIRQSWNGCQYAGGYCLAWPDSRTRT